MDYLKFTGTGGDPVYLRRDIIGGVIKSSFGGTQIILTRTGTDWVSVKGSVEEVMAIINRTEMRT